MMRRFGLVVLMTLLASLLFVPPASPAAAGDCDSCAGGKAPTGDLTGSVTVVGQGHNAGRHLGGKGGTSCEGCVWRLVPLCFYRSPEDGGNDAMCMAAVSNPNCADNQVAFAVYLSTPADPVWDQVDVVCRGPGAGLVQTAAIGPAIDTAFASLPLPATPVTVQPPNGAVVRLPAIFRTERPAPVPATTTAQVGPVAATLTITATIDHYVWHFGDGTTRESSSPGAPYSDGASVPAEGSGTPYVTHTYDRAGTYPVSVEAVWTGTYVFAGSVTGTIQTARTVSSQPVPLRVSAARSQLVSR